VGGAAFSNSWGSNSSVVWLLRDERIHHSNGRLCVRRWLPVSGEESLKTEAAAASFSKWVWPPSYCTGNEGSIKTGELGLYQIPDMWTQTPKLGNEQTPGPKPYTYSTTPYSRNSTGIQYGIVTDGPENYIQGNCEG
jgi:hypothetical protein